MESIAHSYNMKKGMLDDDYELYPDGTVKNTFDKSQYPGGQNHTQTLSASRVSDKVKDDFLESASPENLELVKKLIGR